jgi:SAM-dependent methyltransferase
MTRTAIVGPTSDFSRIAMRYDATRDVPPQHLATCYARMVRLGFFPLRGVLLDAGCGTGQMSLPLAGMGYELCGIDISLQMISIARAKFTQDRPARFVVADARAIPFADSSFHAVVLSKLLQHVQSWQTACREIVRVVKPGGCIVHIAERGAFGNAVRQYFARRADALGFPDRFLGMRDRSELVDFLTSQSCPSIPVDVTDLRWEKQITFGEALGQLRDRLLAEFWYLPSKVYERLLRETARWITEHPDGRATIEHMTPYLVADVFRKVTEA